MRFRIHRGATVIGGPALVEASGHEREETLLAAAQAAHKRLRKVEPFWA